MGLEQMIDSGLKHKCVVDSNIADAAQFIPAWLSSTRNRLIHNIIGDKEECL